MHSLEGKDFFENIRRSVKVSYFVASIIPLALLTYFSIKYVYPYVSNGDYSKVPMNIMILLFLTVSASVLGLVLTTKATNSSISSAQNLNAKLNSLYEITKQFRETLYLDILLEKIMHYAMELTDTESGSLLLYDEDGNLTFRVSMGKNSGSLNGRIDKPGKGISSWVAENRQPALINDVSADTRFDRAFDIDMGFKTKSVNCVPLTYANELIGVVELRNKRDGNFTRQDQAILCSLADQASISIAHNRSNEQQKSNFIQITEILVNTQDYVQNKIGHARKVAGYANMIGKRFNFDESRLKKLYYASLLHDVGMLKLDNNDRSITEKVRQHPRFGHDLIKPISLWSDLADIILCHHERFDGTGYPSSKQGEDIPLEARILSVADRFDILTSDYSYKAPASFDSALREIEGCSGTRFDPVVVKELKASIKAIGNINE